MKVLFVGNSHTFFNDMPELFTRFVEKTTGEKPEVVMLADPMISVNRFFEREDRDKQFLYRLLMEEKDPEAAMENYRKGLKLINSQEKYDAFLNSGFNVIIRDDNRSIEETLELAEKAFGLCKTDRDYHAAIWVPVRKKQ